MTSLITDKYFTKTRNVIKQFGDREVKAGIFLRHDCIVAIQPAIDFIKEHYPYAKVKRNFEEGAFAPSKSKLFTVSGNFKDLVELETGILQRVGFGCISAYNAYKMCLALPKTMFMDMHARHATGEDMVKAAGYGASIGSKAAKMQGAIGFIGSSVDVNAPYFGGTQGLGTTPHALIGYAYRDLLDKNDETYALLNCTLHAIKMFVKANPGDKNITALVDFVGREVSDTLQIADWFHGSPDCEGKKLNVRLDTHGGRYSEGLDYNRSVEIVANWLRVKEEYDVVREVLGHEVMDAVSDEHIDRVRKVLFGTGVSAANIINMRQQLDDYGFTKVGIVGSSGFDLFKCQIMSKARVPLDMIGTGSFLPKTLSETYATCDYYNYDNINIVKVGREFLFDEEA